MSIHVALTHRTSYRFDRPVTLLPHVIRLRPAPHCRTPVLSYSLKVEPGEQFLNWQQDPYGNYQARLVFPKPARELTVAVEVVADVSAINPFDFFLEEAAEKIPFQYDPVLTSELTPYRHALASSPLVAQLMTQIKREVMVPGRRTIDVLCDLNRIVHEKVKYVIRMEPGVQSPEETLEKGTGSCRDSGWLLVQVLRHLGLASRFVSGYLIQLTPDVKPIEGPPGPSQDFTDLHAWAEVYLPGAGWVGLDATSGLLTAEGHIPLACTAEPSTAAPVHGAFAFTPKDKDDKVKESFEFHMQVQRIREDPRVTKPYEQEQWQRIVTLGQSIDEHLQRDDVRLSMGGEPTFVGIDDLDSPQWNTDALGPEKRARAGELFRRLARRFATGPLLHFGQGKWYPGEQLPRWALGCYWRKDGLPIWRDEKLIADDTKPGSFGTTEALRFITALSQRLNVSPDDVHPAFEDVWYHLWRERRLPTNVDPFDAKLKDPMERARLAKIFEQGLDKVVGYTLPLQRWWVNGQPTWKSGAWFFRSERMYLIPGDSPMGYRLPLDSLPWASAGDLAQLDMPEADPMQVRPPLPNFHTVGRPGPRYTTPALSPSSQGIHEQGWWGNRHDGELRSSRELPRWNQSARDLVRLALCVEPRQGRLHVFMPPQRYLEDYLELVTAIEDTAAALNLPVLIEGYTPPYDPRIEVFKVTPDPGVIEVNIHPSMNWNQLTDRTEIIYEEARQSRLAAEKFMMDGRHVGTGGGNHVIMGAASPQDSPMLRRPDVLASLVTYWNNHPSLSYLFSGMFVGPTSQSPRIDEARHDSLYELEIALKQIPANQQVPPWLVDRLLRNLLVDVTGNTHRTAFCIDKLYSPDSSSGRLGLLELRDFEMPPHPRMSLAQQLLLRGLIASFWKNKYPQKLVRWGTALHDRFMLPHFVWQDFGDVIDDLRRAGFAFEKDWFLPHLEFRFPRVGSLNSQGLRLDLRHAIEPWHTLGEEATAGGTARYVDSSVERMEIKVTNMTGERHLVTCNGRRLPLHPTGVVGQFVAGIRYRAWQPPACLHPNIGTHSPLIFDVVDTWSNRSVGGCSYHVSHPGGRSFDSLPVNALEAQTRRVSRFFSFGHTIGPMQPVVEPTNPHFPLTLDLRLPVPMTDTVIGPGAGQLANPVIASTVG